MSALVPLERARDAAPEVDVCVVGAGPVGGALACLLARRGARVAIVDRAALPPMEDPAFDGRAYAIAAGSRTQLLEPAGIWSRLPIPPGPIDRIRVTDGRPGRAASPLALGFDAAADGPGTPFGHLVDARALRVALNRTLHDTDGLLVLAPATASIEAVGRDVRLRLGDGSALRAKLVVAAEGRASPLRAAAGIRVSTVRYRQAALVSAIAHAAPHNNEALEHFLPPGPFAVLPMAGTAEHPHLSAVVWTDERERAARLHGASEAVFAHELRRRLPDPTWLGALRPVGRRFHYELSALHAERMIGERLALVGDAAHGIHPIAGQGLNLGFRDAIALAAAVGEALASGNDPGDPALLRRYQAARRPDNLAMLFATDALDRLFSNDRPALRLARDLGIAAVDRVPALKSFFVRRAVG